MRPRENPFISLSVDVTQLNGDARCCVILTGYDFLSNLIISPQRYTITVVPLFRIFCYA
jgi:hypothetical protein